MFLCFFVVPKLEVIFPAEISSKTKLEEFLRIPVTEWTFKNQNSVQNTKEELESRTPSTNMMSTGKICGSDVNRIFIMAYPDFYMISYSFQIYEI